MSDEKEKVTEQEPTREASPPGEDTAPPEDRTVTLSPEEYEELKTKAEERDRFFQQLQRTVADFDNYQKRVKRDRPLWEIAKLRRFLLDLLPAVDDLERILNAAAEDISKDDLITALGLLGEKMKKILADWDVERIESEGEAFDPNRHEALRQESADGVDSGSVLSELRRGYTLKGNVLRAAQVVVAAGEAADTAESTAGSENEEDESA